MLHRTGASTANSTLEAYKTQTVGAHFLVAEDGTIYQTADLRKATQHVGKIKARCNEEGTCSRAESRSISEILSQKGKKYGQKVSELSQREQKTKNYPERYPTSKESIGIEVVGTVDPESGEYRAPTPEQLLSVQELVEGLQQKYGLKDSDIYKHGETSYKNESEGENLGY
jgi:N-acetyl-anhydromuramyl-L-alanine amidase AmpD